MAVVELCAAQAPYTRRCLCKDVCAILQEEMQWGDCVLQQPLVLDLDKALVQATAQGLDCLQIQQCVQMVV
jgi:hypothetical protein